MKEMLHIGDVVTYSRTKKDGGGTGQGKVAWVGNCLEKVILKVGDSLVGVPDRRIVAVVEKFQSKGTDDWRVIRHPDVDNNYYEGPLAEIVDGDGKTVCDFGDYTQYYPSVGTEPSLETLQLFAAAPLMLAALNDLLDGLDANREGECQGLSQKQWHDRVAKARDAVAKAEEKL